MIDIYIVHNNEPERLRNIEDTISKLELNKDLFQSIKYSESLSKVSLTKNQLYYRHLKLILVRLWMSFRIKRASGRKCDRQDFILALRIIGSRRMDSVKASAELDVTAKHILAWQSFIESNASHLIVLESDAIIENFEQFKLFIEKVRNLPANSYVSLTAPFSLDALGIPKSLVRRNSDFVEVQFQFTNTAAGYVLSRNLTEKMLKICGRQDPRKQIAIDWLMNECFLKLAKCSNSNGKTIFPNSELVINGSLKGKYGSTIQE